MRRTFVYKALAQRELHVSKFETTVHTFPQGVAVQQRAHGGVAHFPRAENRCAHHRRRSSSYFGTVIRPCWCPMVNHLDRLQEDSSTSGGKPEYRACKYSSGAQSSYNKGATLRSAFSAYKTSWNCLWRYNTPMFGYQVQVWSIEQC